MASGQTSTAVDSGDWKTVDESDWKTVGPSTEKPAASASKPLTSPFKNLPLIHQPRTPTEQKAYESIANPQIPKPMGSPILPAEGIISTAVGLGTEKAGEKMGLPWWINLPAGVLAGGLAAGSGSVYQRLKSLPPEQRAEAFKKAMTKLPWGIGSLAKAWQTLFEDVPKESVPAPPLKWPTQAAEQAPTAAPPLKWPKQAKATTVKAPKLKFSTREAPKAEGTVSGPAPPLKWPAKAPAEEAQGTVRGPAPPLKFSTRFAGEEGEAGGAAAVPKGRAPQSPAPQPKPSAPQPPVTQHTVDPREIGMQNVAFKAQVKTDTIAKRMLDAGMTPEQVGAMSDTEINQAATETISPITGKPYESFRGKGAELHRSPSAGKADIVRTMRQMLAQRKQ